MSPDYQANMEVRLNAMEEQMRNLTGRLEETQNRVDQLQQQLERQMSDMQMQMQEQASAPAPAAPTPQPEAPSTIGAAYSADGAASVNPVDPTKSAAANAVSVTNPNAPASADTAPAVKMSVDATTGYENAFSLLKEGNTDRAQAEFKSFLATYPNDPLAANARYWLAETYYVQNDFENSARAFAEAYKKNPEGPKAADNLLKMGLSLAGLKRSKDACVALKQLDKAFGATKSAIVARGEQERKKLGCE
jgi:tol-pal system protein YbgF